MYHFRKFLLSLQSICAAAQVSLPYFQVLHKPQDGIWDILQCYLLANKKYQHKHK